VQGHASEKILSFLEKEQEVARNLLENNKNKSNNTWIFPTVQMGPFGIHMDQHIVTYFLQHLEEDAKLLVCSPYLNLTQQYRDLLLRSSSYIEVTTASPKVIN
jgi:CDP-diacylglycerol--glycerol-3-phosphate 3-phosphatidyltransferase